jgi:Mn2+/Fe2+ NRAMP family transporter
LFYSAVLNVLVAPPLLVIIMLIANNERVMGKHTNTRALNVLGWFATALMIAAAVAMIASAAAG